jgi:hypothetical protein
VGHNGYFDIYPYGTSKDDWRAIKVTVKPTTITGVIPMPNTEYIEYATTPTRRFRTGVQAAMQVYFYGFIAVADGNPRNYVSNENNGLALLFIPGSSNSNANGPLLEPYLGNGSARLTSLLKPGAINTSTEPNDYYGFAQIWLTTANKDVPAGTVITFKACPLNHFSEAGVPDPAWTIDVTTQVYAN